MKILTVPYKLMYEGTCTTDAVRQSGLRSPLARLVLLRRSHGVLMRRAGGSIGGGFVGQHAAPRSRAYTQTACVAYSQPRELWPSCS